MRPWVSIVSGVSIDGRISLAQGLPSKHTMPLPLEVRVYLHSLRSRFDAISVGCNTVRLDNPFLRVEYVEGRSPIRVVPCNRLDILPDMNVFKPPGGSILVTTEGVDQELLDLFRKRGVRVLIAGKDRVDVKVMLKGLYELGIRNIMVEGGAKLNGSLLSQALVDELIIIHHPIVVCSKDAPPFAEADNCLPVSFRLVNVEVVEGILITRWIPEEGIRNQSLKLWKSINKGTV